jgi:peroxiredoxin
MSAARHRLSVGSIAPKFKAVDVSGKHISLEAIDSRYILLAFFRYSGCPWCNVAIHRLSLEYATLIEHGCEVLAFVQSEKQDIVDNIYGRHVIKPAFSIIADRKRRIYDLYGVNDSVRAAVRSLARIPTWLHSIRKQGFKQRTIDGNLFLVPASFLIDGRSRKIIQASYGSSFYETEAFMDIYGSVFFREL